MSGSRSVEQSGAQSFLSVFNVNTGSGVTSSLGPDLPIEISAYTGSISMGFFEGQPLVAARVGAASAHVQVFTIGKDGGWGVVGGSRPGGYLDSKPCFPSSPRMVVLNGGTPQATPVVTLGDSCLDGGYWMDVLQYK
jgi:hypothetical protein